MKQLAPCSMWWHRLPHKSAPRSMSQKGEAGHGPHWNRRAQGGSQIYILAEWGEIFEQRIRPEPERFAAVLGARPRARMLIEASTDRE